MNTLIKNVPIAKVGKVFDGREVTRRTLERCVETFDFNHYPVPVGTPFKSIEHPVKRMGIILTIKLENNTLLADIEIFRSPEYTKRLNLFPAISYSMLNAPSLLAVRLTSHRNRADNIMIKDCDISEAN
ncbi:hypothetical protein MXG66_004951 [Salmonella enterica]|nr:hypothetical protein [Salmonella enterica]EDR4376880.1 hypothetical protein [Salmonella enterica]EEG5734010.1 hypothetical protein [Salmonella enterica]EEG6157975.1 hypothetical protein [Salmonella enterica]EEH7434181.1 hypothetical protein [Salmonella enterica]